MSGIIEGPLWDEYTAVAQEIADHPELAFEETLAHRALTTWLTHHGFTVAPVVGMPTAFTATFGSGEPAVGILLEYDALPEIGHGCGHHLIAAGGALAAILASRAGLARGRIEVIGCPAEERGAGKALLCDRGVFDDLDAAMMFHPASVTVLARSAVAAVNVAVEFHGRASHTARAPEHGRNALSSMIHLFTGLDALRARLGRWDTVGGIITDGGAAVNIVPSYTRAELMLRAPTGAAVDELLARVRAIATGAALMAGTECVVTPDSAVYAERRNNRTMLEALAPEMLAEQLVTDQPPRDESLGSSDIGNVSLRVPTIHPTVRVVPSPVPSHSLEFAQATRRPYALAETAKMAAAMANLARRVLADDELRGRIRAEFARGGHDAPGTDFSSLGSVLTQQP